MNIKEVGSLTGISENIIRSYEEQGLITINEDSINNSEYNYNEENINELKRVEILRKLDIPISEIREFKKGRIALKNILENKFQELKSSKLRDDELNNIDSKSIIEVILKDLRKKDNVKLEDYFEEVNYFESEEYTKLISDLKEFNTVSLATQIIYTLMLSGPLLWLPINISRGNSKFIVLNIILSIISVILLIFSWRKYLKQTKKKTKGTIPLLISMIVGIILTLAIFAGVAKLQEVIFVPKDYLMFMFKPPY
ncbi:MAG: MerR family transcriptional regulator, partial [Clostridiales bacterium]|nr:MerR family transcriptional regulator [Clostridiales bacterium]